MSFSAKLGQLKRFSTDDYELIEEKDARTVTMDPMSTFRMTTNTASAGIILNQLRYERSIDKSMVRIEEMLNYFRYESKIPEKDMFKINLLDLLNINSSSSNNDLKSI